MCFSASASFTAGALLGVAGLATVARVPSMAQRMIAGIPLLFGLQQTAEGFVWIGSQIHNDLMIYGGSHIFIFFASVIWPLWMPITLTMFEPKRWYYFIPSFIAGSLIALWFFVGILPAGIAVTKINCNIVYSVANHPAYVIAESIIYLIATVLPCFLAHDRTVKALGVILTISYTLSYFFYAHAFISVWCFFAAILSMLSIIIALRYPRMHR